jgi:hypothetical protein
MPKTLKKRSPGGPRSNSGRPRKTDKDRWGQITCVLRHDTIAQLRAGAAGRFFGEFLQQHLDRYPLPTREEYLSLSLQRRPVRAPRITPLAPVIPPGLSFREGLALWFEQSGGVPKKRTSRDEDDAQRMANLAAIGLNKLEIQQRMGISRKRLRELWDPSRTPSPGFAKA